MGLLLFAGSAVAQSDRCLEGSATLGDQRALRTLRAGIESACPCASFASAGRGVYRSCARPLLDSVIAGATLRAQCRRIALRDIKHATCGTARVSCGRFRPSSSAAPVSCRVKPADRCQDTPSVQMSICAAATHCSDVVEWTAGTCVDPRLPGPRNAGARILTLTKPSAVDGTPRVLDTVVWYPTAATGTIGPSLNALPDAPVDLSGGPHPLLIFSHGACGVPNGARYLMPLLAAYGFVIASPPHPGSTFSDYPDCLTTAGLINSAVERPADASFVLDSMLAATVDSGSPFFGAIDGTRVGMSGHSFGGYTTFAATAADPRFKVAMLFAPAVPTTLPTLSIPSLFMIGEVDSVVAAGSFSTDNQERRLAYDNAAPPKLFVEILETGHFAFSDACFPGLSAIDCNYPVTLSQDEAHQIVRRWALPFLQRYLRGDTSYEPFLTLPAPPGVAVDRVL